LCVLFKIIDLGGRRGDAMRGALARWRYPLASSEALVVLHRAVRPASLRRIRWSSKSLSICLHFCRVDLVVGHNYAENLVMVNITKIKLDYCYYSHFEPIRIVWAPTVNDGCQFGHHLQRRANDLSKI